MVPPVPPKITQKVTYLINSCIKCVSLTYQIFKSTFLESAHVLVLINHILALSDWKYFQSCLGFYNSMYSNDSRWEAKKGAFNCWSPFLLLSSSRLSDIQNACLYITEITLASRKKFCHFFQQTVRIVTFRKPFKMTHVPQNSMISLEVKVQWSW